MLTSYFKIALRYLVKNKIYSFINVAGLSLALSCAMLMILYTKDELSFDRFHKDVESIYRIGIDVRNPDGSSMDKIGATSIFQGPRFIASLPEIESYVRVKDAYKDVKLNDDVHSQKIIQADANFFTFFTFPLLRGNPNTALLQPQGVVVSEDMAMRHFGTIDALDKTILFESDGAFRPYIVTGVVQRSPQNSSIQFEMLIPLVISVEDEQSVFNWMDLPLSTFVKLSALADAKEVAIKMQNVFEHEAKEAITQVRSFGFDQSFYHQLQPITDLHLSNEFTSEGVTSTSNPIYSYILSGIAIFILIIACINFINLTIARSVRRAKEIGIRKVVGSGRKQLIAQFLGESFMLCFFSFVGAVPLVQLLLPLFNGVVNKQLSLSYLLDGKLVAGYLTLLVITGLMAGFYPAVVLSGYHPVQTLYNQIRLSGRNYLQQGLIIFQFGLAAIMIIATFTVYHQFEYLTTKDLGYDADQVLSVSKRNLSHSESKLFTEELMKNPNILVVAPQRHATMNGKLGGDSIYNFVYESVNEVYTDLLKIQIIEGRNFSSSLADSANAALVNESFVKMAGWKDPIGKEIEMFPFKGKKRVVVGIVKNYHFETLKEEVKPQLFIPTLDPEDFYRHVLIKIQPNSEASVIPYIEKTFKKLFPALPYSYQFYEQINFQNYVVEANWKKVILLSAFVTIFIAGIGLFGLSTLTAEHRFKEIGIRKVLGATVNAIVITLFKDLLTLISVALLIAMPLAYYICNSWLETYPYRIEIGLLTFAMAGVLVIVIATLTISYQSIKTALMNPADTLKRE